jgi:hypothetical protein
MVLDFDATLIESHSDKEGARGTWKRTFGFHPLLCYLDDTSEPLAGMFRPGNASSDSAADHIAVLDEALAQIPSPYRESRPILARADSAGGSHEFVDALRERGARFTVGFQMGEAVREATLRAPEPAWVPALDQDGEEREGAEVCELNSLELILIAQTRIAWIQLLCLTGDARLWEPKRLRYRLFHTAAQVVRTGRRVRLRLQRSWPWSWELSRAFARLRLLPAAP